MAENFQQRLDDMDACIKKTTCEVRGFDNDLVRRLLQNIKAVKDDLIEVHKSSIYILYTEQEEFLENIFIA